MNIQGRRLRVPPLTPRGRETTMKSKAGSAEHRRRQSESIKEALVAKRETGWTSYIGGVKGKRWTVVGRKNPKCAESCTCKRHTQKNDGQFKRGVARPDVSENMKRRHAAGETHRFTDADREKGKQSPGFSGWHHTDEARAKIRKNTYWHVVNARSRPVKPEYGSEWTYTLRAKVRERDGNRCVLCGQENGRYKLIVHHLDYDKTHNVEENLATLCRPCHTTGHKRGLWPIELGRAA